MSVFASKIDAEKVADAKNAEPLKEGQERRTAVKVYAVTNGVKTVYVATTGPSPAVAAAAPELGVSVELVASDPILPVDSYLSRLTPEQLAEAKKLLGV